MEQNETIAAISTPRGAGGIGIIRLSGRDAVSVADSVFRPFKGDGLAKQRGYTARYGTVYDGKRDLDEAVVLVYRAPHSYTGEDCVEIMCHGGEQVCRSVLRAVLDAGCEPAGRGEFTRRALLNGRITLTQAEAVADMIGASSAAGQSAARKLAEGGLYRLTERLAKRVTSLQAVLSASIDFPEEDVEEIGSSELRDELIGISRELERLVGSYETGRAVLRGMSAAIVGSPNVGKSTLLNLISRERRSIVTPVPGTTRDIVEQRVTLGGVSIALADTAGIREGADEVESIGIELAKGRIPTSDIIFAVFDASRELSGDDLRIIELTRDLNTLAVINKTDLPRVCDVKRIEKAYRRVCEISAKDESSFDTVDRAVSELVGTNMLDENEPLLANERQRGCAVRALEAVRQALGAAELGALDAVFAMLSDALDALYSLSGQNAAESVLDEVFENFCVGK